MKNIYSVSLCKNGLLGGLLYLKDKEPVYCTNKLTVPAQIRRLHIPYCDIQSAEKSPLYTVVITKTDGQAYRFLVFFRKAFLCDLDRKRL